MLSNTSEYNVELLHFNSLQNLYNIDPEEICYFLCCFITNL